MKRVVRFTRNRFFNLLVSSGAVCGVTILFDIVKAIQDIPCYTDILFLYLSFFHRLTIH